MSRASWPLLAVLGLAAAAGSSGCTAEHAAMLARWERQHQYPSDYNDMPLTQQFDTHQEIERLADERLRRSMTLWLQMREQYLQAWRQGGEHDEQVALLRIRRQKLYVAIQDLYRNVPRPVTRDG